MMRRIRIIVYFPDTQQIICISGMQVWSDSGEAVGQILIETEDDNHPHWSQLYGDLPPVPLYFKFEPSFFQRWKIPTRAWEEMLMKAGYMGQVPLEFYSLP